MKTLIPLLRLLYSKHDVYTHPNLRRIRDTGTMLTSVYGSSMKNSMLCDILNEIVLQSKNVAVKSSDLKTLEECNHIKNKAIKIIQLID